MAVAAETAKMIANDRRGRAWAALDIAPALRAGGGAANPKAHAITGH
jgi:hypothetical protein